MSSMSPEFDQLLRMQMVGLFLSPVLYGVSLALASGTIRAILRQRCHQPETGHPKITTHSAGAGPRTRLALLLYAVFVVGCASAALGQDTQWMRTCEQQRLFATQWTNEHSGEADSNSADFKVMKLMEHVRVGGPALVLAVWAAATFLAWRSVILSKAVKLPLVRRATNMVSYVLVATLFVAGVLHFFKDSHIGSMPDEVFLVILMPPVTAALALIITLHNTLLHRPHHKKTGLAMTIRHAGKLMMESGAPIVAASTAYALLFFYDQSAGTEVVLRILLPYVCAIFTLLIAQRMVRPDRSKTSSWLKTSMPGRPSEPLLSSTAHRHPTSERP